MNTDYSTIRMTVAEHVAQLLLDAPPVNCVSPELLQDLHWAIETLRRTDGLRAVVVGSANPKIFCAGADMKQFLSWSAEEGERMSAWGSGIYRRLSELPVPVICAVNGGAYGGGLELALACDIRVFEKQAKAALPECKLGVLPAYGGTHRLPQVAGRGHAAYLLYTGEAITGETALQWGLCEAVTEKGGALDKAMEIASAIVKNGPEAVRAIKECLAHACPLPDTAMENSAFGRLCRTENKEEGVHAFLEKREPRFTDPK